MSNLVIVAIPREDDPVWKISSEKVPHLTILFLGDGNNPKRGQIAQFLEHAASTTLMRFGLDVDRRGELGADKADVLFFQENWELPRVREFRSQLLKDDNIKTAHDSVEQFDGWTPHLTLGHPESPAKPTSERIYWVQFDRIALWDGDFSGPEFILKQCYPMEVMMNGLDGTIAARGRQFLSHHGVKGMKWGVRKSTPSARPVTADGVVKRTLGVARDTKIKTKGGHNHPATPDAIKVAMATQKLKASGPHALSNQELQDVATRLNLERQVATLASGRKSAAGKAVDKALEDPGRTLDQVGRAAAAGKELVDLARRG